MAIITPKIEEFLKSVSNVFKYTSGGNEIQIFCPYCGDAYRKHNPKWGHLYIDINTGLFYCHRCNEKGTILKLLDTYDFDDEEELNRLKTIFKVNAIRSKSESRFIKKSLSSKVNINYQEYLKSWYANEHLYVYLYDRLSLTLDELLYYRITVYDADTIAFCNYEFSPIVIRHVDNSKKRYQKLSHEYYTIQIDNDIRNYVITEGVFDIISADKYGVYTNYHKISINGKNYIKAIEELFTTNNINSIILYIDNDIDERRFLKFLESFIRRKNIHINHLEIRNNPFGKDIGELIVKY